MPSHKTTTAEQCAQEVMEIVPQVVHILRSEMRKNGTQKLSLPQFRILSYVKTNPKSSVSEAGEHLGVTRATASALVERLVQKGLLERADDPNERRKAILNLTKAGNQHFLEARKEAQAVVAHWLDDLPQGKLSKIIAGLTLLGQAFDGVNGHNGRQ